MAEAEEVHLIIANSRFRSLAANSVLTRIWNGAAAGEAEAEGEAEGEAEFEFEFELELS